MLSFDEMISFECLYAAHRRARLGKRHKKEVILFEASLSENLWALHYDLKYGRYRVGEYRKFMIYDPKEREIQAISYRDRIVQHALCDNYLMPLLDRYLIYDNAACRKEKGTSFAVKRLRNFICEHYKKHGNEGYFVKIDISKYFPGIDHDVLKGKLAAIVEDERMLRLLYQIIDSYEGEPNRGLPMGNQSSQCFALLYLNSLDRFFKQTLGIRYYVRYMDDILMLVSEKALAKTCLAEAARLAEEVRLSLNAKSQIVAVKNGVRFIGRYFRIAPTGKLIQQVCSPSKRYMLARIARSKYSAEKKREAAASYRSYLQEGKNYFFKERLLALLT